MDIVLEQPLMKAMNTVVKRFLQKYQMLKIFSMFNETNILHHYPIHFLDEIYLKHVL